MNVLVGAFAFKFRLNFFLAAGKNSVCSTGAPYQPILYPFSKTSHSPTLHYCISAMAIAGIQSVSQPASQSICHTVHKSTALHSISRDGIILFPFPHPIQRMQYVINNNNISIECAHSYSHSQVQIRAFSAQSHLHLNTQSTYKSNGNDVMATCNSNNNHTDTGVRLGHAFFPFAFFHPKKKNSIF